MQILSSSVDKVQRRATKMVRGLDSMSYDKRLKVLGLLSHEQRRLRGDLTEAYKILNGKDIVDKATFFQLSPTVSTPVSYTHLTLPTIYSV